MIGQALASLPNHIEPDSVAMAPTLSGLLVMTASYADLASKLGTRTPPTMQSEEPFSWRLHSNTSRALGNTLVGCGTGLRNRMRMESKVFRAMLLTVTRRSRGCCRLRPCPRCPSCPSDFYPGVIR